MRLAKFLGLSGGAPKAGSRNHSRAVHDLTALCHGLLSERGEVSGVLLATQAQQAYESFEAPQRHAFFSVLVKEFSPDPDAVGRSGEAYRADPSAANLAELQRVVEPPRQELFRRLNMAPGGTRMLVNMRRDLLDEARAHPEWAAIAADLEHLRLPGSTADFCRCSASIGPRRRTSSKS